MARPYRVSGYSYVPARIILILFLIMADPAAFKPVNTPGLFLVLLDLPVYFIWRKNRLPD